MSMERRVIDWMERISIWKTARHGVKNIWTQINVFFVKCSWEKRPESRSRAKSFVSYSTESRSLARNEKQRHDCSIEEKRRKKEKQEEAGWEVSRLPRRRKRFNGYKSVWIWNKKWHEHSTARRKIKVEEEVVRLQKRKTKKKKNEEDKKEKQMSDVFKCPVTLEEINRMTLAS